MKVRTIEELVSEHGILGKGKGFYYVMESVWHNGSLLGDPSHDRDFAWKTLLQGILIFCSKI
ncbi:hypothetical protein C5167_015178 [Papaver somniferum]|uniref:Uncharacterized protein n=1 Tax=Papaver somniferum TaxID=3469 RepID=A0A4Y7J8D2_PAPSO|nr:hypothetical protein C5167_015178 [Papaver somniferum]